jgi:hypothetical protein
MPEIILKAPIYDADAEQLQKCFTQGVIELENDEHGKSFVVSLKTQLKRLSSTCIDSRVFIDYFHYFP